MVYFVQAVWFSEMTRLEAFCVLKKYCLRVNSLGHLVNINGK